MLLERVRRGERGIFVDGALADLVAMVGLTF